MKIDLSKLLSVLVQLVLAAPTIVAAVKPVLDEAKRPAAAPADAEPSAA